MQQRIFNYFLCNLHFHENVIACYRASLQLYHAVPDLCSCLAQGKCIGAGAPSSSRLATPFASTNSSLSSATTVFQPMAALERKQLTDYRNLAPACEKQRINGNK